ncbi:DUF421 domain-containing protein [Brevibacillus centrosporus]|uniref:DUF421 domain-containing protein n=1 Tax=Brevibacillus centrosporus TaxID=54910 RepID=UPI003B018217
MDTHFLSMLLRTSLTFLFMLVLTRLLGKKQLSHLTFFNYVTGITFGSIAAEVVIQKNQDLPLFQGLASLVWWALLTLLVGHIGLKWPKARIAIDGEPTIIIRNGRILESAMAKARLNLDDLTMMLRERDAFSIREVEYAILEPHGKLSVMKKPEYLNASKKDVGAQIPLHPLIPTEIISDGKYVDKNLKELGISTRWVERRIKEAGIQSVADVFYAELQSDRSLFIDRRDPLP